MTQVVSAVNYLIGILYKRLFLNVATGLFTISVPYDQ